MLAYGIYFDTGKADVKVNSKPQFDEIAKVLAANPALKVQIVRHTDNQGAKFVMRSAVGFSTAGVYVKKCFDQRIQSLL